MTQAGGVAHCGPTGLGPDCRDPAVIVRFRSRCSAVKTRHRATGASQFGVDLVSFARAFRAALEPLIPLLPKARRDTGFPAAASLLAIRRAWLVSA